MKIEVFGTAICGVCRQVEAYLKKENIEYDYKTVGKDITIDELSTLIGAQTRSVPVILVDGVQTSFSILKERVDTSKGLGVLEL